MARRGDQRRQIDGEYEERRDIDRTRRRRRAETEDEPFEVMGEAISAEDYQEPRRRRRPQQRPVEDGRRVRGDAREGSARSGEGRPRRRQDPEAAPRDAAAQRSSRRRPKPQSDPNLMDYFGETADFEVVEQESASKRRRSGLASLFGAAQKGAQRRERPQEGRQRKARPRPQQDGRDAVYEGVPVQEDPMEPMEPMEFMEPEEPMEPEDLFAEPAPRPAGRARAQESQRRASRERAEADEDATPRRRRRQAPQDAGAHDVTEIEGEALTFGALQEEPRDSAPSSRRRRPAAAGGAADAVESMERQPTKRRRRPAADDTEAAATGQAEGQVRPARTVSPEGDEKPRRRRRRPEAADDAAPEGSTRRRAQRPEGDASEDRTREGHRRTRRRDDEAQESADGGRATRSRSKDDASQAGEDGTQTKRRRRRPRHEATTQAGSRGPSAPEDAAAAPATKKRRKKRTKAERPASSAEAAAAIQQLDGRAPEGRPGGAGSQSAMGGAYGDLGVHDYGSAGAFDRYDGLFGGFGQEDLAGLGSGPAHQGWEGGPYTDPYADPYADAYGYGDDGEWGARRRGRAAGERRGGSRPASLDWQRGLGHEGMTFEEDRRAEEAARAHRDARQRGAEERLAAEYAEERPDWLPDFGEDFGSSYDGAYGEGRNEYTAAPYGEGDVLDTPVVRDIPEAAQKGSASSADAVPIAQRPLWTPAPEVGRYATRAFTPTTPEGEGGRKEDAEDSWQEFAELIARDAFAGAAGGRAREDRTIGLAGVTGTTAEAIGASSHVAAASASAFATSSAMWGDAAEAGAAGGAKDVTGAAPYGAAAADVAFVDDDLGDDELDEFDNYDDYNPFDVDALEDRAPEAVDEPPVVDGYDTAVEDVIDEGRDAVDEAEADADDGRDAAFAGYATQREEPRIPIGYMPFVDDVPEDFDDADDVYGDDATDAGGIWADAIIDGEPEGAGAQGGPVSEPAVEPAVEDVPEDAGVRRRVPNFIFGAQVSEPEVFEDDEPEDDGPWYDEKYEEWPDEVEEVDEIEEVEEAEEVDDFDHDVYEDAVIEEDTVAEEDPVVEEGPVLEDAGDGAADSADYTYVVDDAEEEVPTEHVEVHLDPPGPGETGATGTFASKRRVPWRSRWEARHIVDDRTPRGPKKRRPVFLICYILLVVGLVAAGFVAYQYTYDSIVRYERSRSSTFMDNLIDDLQAGGEAAARRKEQIISSLELGANESRDLLTARLDRGVGRPGYRLEQQGDATDATDPVYTLYVDESPYLMLELHAVNSYVRFGILAITDWEIADAYVFEPGAKLESVQPLGQGQSMEVSVPDGAIAYVNGTALTGNDLSEPPNILAGFVYASRFVEVPEAITYRVDGLHTAPEVWATDSAGNPVELSHSGSIYRATSLMVPNATPDELPVDVLTLAETWSRFLTGDLGGADVNYGLGQVTSFLVPGSALYEQAVAYARGSEISFVMKHSLDSFSDESVVNCVRYNEDLFSCDVHFKKNMTLNATSTLRSDVFDNSLIFAYVDELGTVSQPGWYLVDMQPTGEVA